MRMIRYLPIAVMALLLYSCTTFQYATVSSSSMSMNDKQEFEFENDTVRIIYNFNGENAPINITVENKLNVPVFIDWHNSSLIINGRSVSYVPIQVTIEGTTQSSSYNIGGRVNGYGVSSGNLSAVANLPPSVDFIAPRSYFTRNPMGLTNKFIDNVPPIAYQKLKYSPVEGYTIPVKAAVFTEGASPLQFRSYLSLMVGNRDAFPVAYEHSFFVSQLIRSSQSPGTIWMNGADRGNQFFVMKASSGGAAVGGLFLGIGVVAVALVAANDVQSDVE